MTYSYYDPMGREDVIEQMRENYLQQNAVNAIPQNTAVEKAPVYAPWNYRIENLPGVTGTFRSWMERAIRGEQPSAAEQQMQQALGRQVAGFNAMARSMPGISPGLALRLASRRAGEAMRGVAGQTGVLRAKEDAATRQMFGDWLARMSGLQTQLTGIQSQRDIARMQTATQKEIAQMQAAAQRAAADRQMWGGLLGGLGSLVALPFLL